MADEINNKAVTEPRGNLYDFIISDRNIYRAIYALESYIDEPYLLGEHFIKEINPEGKEEKKKVDDLELFYKLSDKFNWELINKVIKLCQDKLHEILTNPKELFDVEMYFRLKKYDTDNKKLKYRPLHTASLIDLICMVAILQVLMFEDSDENGHTKQEEIQHDEKKHGRNLSDLSKSIPHNFYGNKPSDSVDRIFQKWQTNYQKYNQLIVESSREFRKSHKYNYEVSLDIKNFFPSISPFYIHAKVCHELCNRYTAPKDIQTLRIAVAKLLFLNVTSKAVENEKFGYYDNPDLNVTEFLKSTKLRLAKGVAQGLPQSYFFGNICMTDIRRIIATESKFNGLDYFYVDDSVIYVGKDFDTANFKKDIEDLNDLIKKEIESHIDKASKADKGKDKEDKQLSEFVIDASCIDFHNKIQYIIEFHEKDKSTFSHIDNTEPLFGLEGIDRLNSATDFFNLDEVDDFISIEKMKALNDYIDTMIEEAKAKAEKDEKVAKAKPAKETEHTNEAKQDTESKEAKEAEQNGQAD